MKILWEKINLDEDESPDEKPFGDKETFGEDTFGMEIHWDGNGMIYHIHHNTWK